MKSAALLLPISPLPLRDPDWSLLRQRNELRLAMLERRFDAVEGILNALESDWWHAVDEIDAHYKSLARAPALFDFATVDAEKRVELLRAWCETYPESYHAHLVLGRYCQGRAGDIRTASWASDVSQEQWHAAAMACALGAEYLLQAIALSPRPALAVEAMMEISRHFGEPDFVAALSHGETPGAPLDREEVGEELFDAAVAHLARHGLAPQKQFPTHLPPALPARQQAERESPSDYWLRYGLAIRPHWPSLIATYSHYLAPRWGGQRGEIEKLVRGPLCASLAEQERNVIRWPGVIDDLTLPAYPEPGEARAVKSVQAAFEQWLARDIPDHIRFDALGKFANFTSYSLRDNVQAHKLHVASVRYCHGTHFYWNVEGPFRDFARLMLIFHLPDEEGAFKLILERGVRWFDDPIMLVIAAVAYRFGMWNFERDPALATGLLDRAAQLAGLYVPDTFTPLAVCRMFWDGGSHEQSVYLASELAERRIYQASAFMYDLRRGWLPDTPPDYLDEAGKLHWLDRAVEEGVSTALYNKAYRLEYEDGLDLTERSNFERVRRLYQGALEQGNAMAMIRLASLSRRCGTEEEKQQAVADMKNLIAIDDDDLAGEAYGEIVLAYKYGQGVPRSEYVAMQWFDRFKELFPTHSTAEWLETQVYGDSGWQMAGRALRAFFGAKASAEHLPPK